MTEELAEDSKAEVRHYLESEIDWDARLQEFMLAHDLTERFGACIACRAPRKTLASFGISELFESGGSLVTGPLPLLICQPCIARMTAALTEDCREVWRNFLVKNFAGPPSDTGFPGFF